MNFKILFFLCLFSVQCLNSLQASNNLPDQIPSFLKNELREQLPLNNSCALQNAFLKHGTSGRLSFATRSGFVLLRKEDILSLTVNKIYGGLILQYWSRGVVRSVHCQGTLKNVMDALGDFPFWQVSRSALVNMNEVTEFIGTRRDAHLVLTDGSTVKVSRNRTGLIYDWVFEDKIG